jgi:EAL domain-containing protein (putative c-di-GMP-specific phosphodiesterase class I)
VFAPQLNYQGTLFSFYLSILNLVRSVISIAHQLNMKVVSEGVESMEQLQLLASQKCDALQGYVLSPPLPFEKFKQYCHIYSPHNI